MKKYFYLLVLSALFVGCSSDGSRELQIDECEFVQSNIKDDPQDYSKTMSLLEVVPGKYELAWKLFLDMPQRQNYDVSLKLKLRLKNKVTVSQETIDKVNKGEKIYSPFKFELIDADGNKLNSGFVAFDLTYSTADTWGTPSQFNKDQTMDFIRFLQSEPGTEIDITMHTKGIDDNVCHCLDDCKNAKGVICEVMSDSSFESFYGSK